MEVPVQSLLESLKKSVRQQDQLSARRASEVQQAAGSFDCRYRNNSTATRLGGWRLQGGQVRRTLWLCRRGKWGGYGFETWHTRPRASYVPHS
jgi:hypothetical protein